MVGPRRPRLLHVSRGADQLDVPQRVPLLRTTPMATRASAPQPEGQVRMGADGKAGRRLASETAHPPSLAPTSLRRQTLKVGAVCGKAACTDLCGGRSAMTVPTANPTALAPGNNR